VTLHTAESIERLADDVVVALKREKTGVTIGGALRLALTMPDPRGRRVTDLLERPTRHCYRAPPVTARQPSSSGYAFTWRSAVPSVRLRQKRTGCFYIVSAEDLQGTRNRVLGEAARLHLDADGRALLDERLRWVQVDTNAGAATIREAIEDDAAGRDVALIFVDTGPALFCGDDENDNIAQRNFIEGFISWRYLPGSPVTVLAWHPSKGATADRLEPRDASAIKGTCDFNLTIWRDEDRVTLHYTKVRAQHFDPIEGKLSTVELEAASGQRYFAPIVTLDVTDDRPERADAREGREAILRHLYVSPRQSADPARPSKGRCDVDRVDIPSSATPRHGQAPARKERPCRRSITRSPRKARPARKALVDQSSQAYRNARDRG
jgi:hypothetical protein